MNRIVIVGGGLAGARTAEALRAGGFAGELTMIGAEPHLPYDRPPLSKAVLKGEADDTTLETDLDALRCERLLARRATGLRLAGDAGGAVETTAGSVAFDGLVIATGATPITLPGDGPYRVLRTIDDARALRSVLLPGRRLVIVGAGWIGAEVATAAALAGCEVTVVEAADVPLAVALEPEVGALTAPWYAEAGVELRHGVKVASVEDGGLALAGGGFIDAHDVLIGIGVRPETRWLTDSGLELDNGVVVDGALRAFAGGSGGPSPLERDGTVRPEIVAAGDCAAWWSARYGRRLRVEHWDAALNAPDVAAASLLGKDATYDPVPYFWSEQFGRMVQYAGLHQGAERLLMRGDPGDRKWAACWLSGDRLDAILTVDRPRDLVQGRRIMAAGGRVDPDLLADPEVPVRNAVPS
ncbi:MAG TPA: FAD-dependent oxidoreductase [Streptosporangiaceae bacterium]|jgi:3-phenylpropionate/trans-cinnamate dioxygenase ferredoxin reductase subunit